jgi:organic radical activating enzyme
MPGLSSLPMEFQLIFWAMLIFLGALCSFVVYSVKKYIEAQDDRLKKHESKLTEISDTLSSSSKDMKEASANVKIDFLEFRKEMSQTTDKIKTETHEIRKDLSTVQTRLIVIKESFDEIDRTQKLYGKMVQDQAHNFNEIQGRVDMAEQNLVNYSSIVKLISEQLRLITSKKNGQ